MRRLIVVAAVLAAVGMGVPRAARAEAKDEAARARAEASSIVVALDAATEHVRVLLRRARPKGRHEEIACLDAALSRVDVAARYGRDHAKRALAAYMVGDVASARAEMMRLGWRRDASREASRAADACAPADAAPLGERPGTTTVRVFVDPSLPRDVTDYP